MTAIIDMTDRSSRPACWKCHRAGEPDTFTSKVVYARKFDARGKVEMRGTRFTVCDAAPCGEELQAAAEAGS